MSWGGDKPASFAKLKVARNREHLEFAAISALIAFPALVWIYRSAVVPQFEFWMAIMCP